VQKFYGDLFDGRWAEAYQLLSTGRRTQEPYPEWIRGFDETEALALESFETGSRPETITAHVVVTDRSSGVFKRRWVTEWKLILESGEWRLDVGVRR
jgi:hypothetical protein